MTDVADISVAVIYPGERVEKMLRPLKASRLTVALDPPDPYEYDFVVADNADTDLGKEVLKKPFHDAHLIYRMRGDLWRELELWDMPWHRKRAAEWVASHVDGVLAVTRRLASKHAEKSGLADWRRGAAGMWIEPENWPTVAHTDGELRAVTLTNMNYERKIEPIIEWAPIVERVLSDVGGRWRIAGRGEHVARLQRGISDLQHVRYAGYVDSENELGCANLMLHPSNLDGEPNAILEGMASGLPVVTNHFEEFLRHDGPLIRTQHSGLEGRLQALADPDRRADWGEEGVAFVDAHKRPEQVAREYERYFTRYLNHV